MNRLVLGVGFSLVGLVTGSASSAGPLVPVCTRNMNDDPAQIRAVFGLIDRMAVRELRALGPVVGPSFYSADRGSIPTEEFVLSSNFHDGREDAAPLQVSHIRRLQFSGEPSPEAAYLVGTRRSAWVERGDRSRYDIIDTTWLVTFSGCNLDTVREMPELSYLLESREPE